MAEILVPVSGGSLVSLGDHPPILADADRTTVPPNGTDVARPLHNDGHNDQKL